MVQVRSVTIGKAAHIRPAKDETCDLTRMISCRIHKRLYTLWRCWSSKHYRLPMCSSLLYTMWLSPAYKFLPSLNLLCGESMVIIVVICFGSPDCAHLNKSRPQNLLSHRANVYRWRPREFIVLLRRSAAFLVYFRPNTYQTQFTLKPAFCARGNADADRRCN